MNHEEIRRLESFSFSEFLYELKLEYGISFKKMAELTDIPYSVLYKYTSGAKARPSLNDFYKIMKFANRSIDDFFLKLLNHPDYHKQLQGFFIHLDKEEIALLKRLNKLEQKQKEVFLKHIMEMLDMILLEDK